MKTIWKFELDDIAEEQDLMLPAGAQILTTDFQEFSAGGLSVLYIWALVDSEAPRIQTRFIRLGTGHPVPNGFEYVETIQDPPFVWHFFRDVSSAKGIPSGMTP